jgi:RNA 2',3'-cyclic 3'-phosphodiesterase
VRLFVALNLPPAVRTLAWNATEPLRTALPTGIAWVREEALHVTLRFLGEQPPAVADELAARLGPLLAMRTPPGIALDAVGAFPNLRRPRVLWIGGPANSTVAELYHDVQRACSMLGFESEPRPFQLHVTIGRVRQGARVDAELLGRTAAAVRLHSGFTATSVDVMESQLGSAGARYRVLAAVPIGSRG